MKPRTVAECVSAAAARLQAAGIDDSRLEAEVLLSHAANISRSRLLAGRSDAVDSPTADALEDMLNRRLCREPLAYITGQREFYGIDLQCGPGVLIPRPETELLVELALCVIQTAGAGRVIDVGTGSGAIAIAVAANAPDAEVTATDASPLALSIAAQNARRAGVEPRVAVRHANLIEGAAVFDVILANLPYVAEAAWSGLAPEIREWEPREALIGGVRGPEMIEELLSQAPAHLARGGLLALEIGADQGPVLRAVARSYFPEAAITVRTDLAGLDRVLHVQT